MARSSLAEVRRVLFVVHRWVALILFLVLVPIGLTGSALAWPEFINRTTNPPPRVTSAAPATLPPSAYLGAAAKAAPGSRAQTLRLPKAPGEAVAVGVSTGRPGPSGSRTVWLDPATAAPIKVASSSSPLFELSHDLHGSLLTPGVGRTLVGWAGVAMLLLSLTGLWIWWPRNGALLEALKWRRTPDGFMNLHHMAGFWISIPLAIVSLTGILISFPAVTAAMFGGAPPTPAAQPRPPGANRAPPHLTPDQAAEAAVAANPGGQLASLTLPGAGRRPPGAAAGPPAWRVELKLDGRTRTVQVVDATGTVAPAAAGPERRPSTPMRTIRELHEGGGSLLWKWIVTLTGLIPLLLALTGLYYWTKLTLRKGRTAA